MKIRMGFVSNSSSSSFCIDLGRITALQMILISEHSVVGERLGIDYADTDSWTIDLSDSHIEGHTVMDNFDMREFFEKIGIPEEVVKWDNGYGWE